MSSERINPRLPLSSELHYSKPFFRVVYDITNCELSVSYQYMYHYRFLFHLMHLSSIYKDQVNTLIVTVHECLYIVYHEQLGIMRHIL